MSNRPQRRRRRAQLRAGTLEQLLNHNVARVARRIRRLREEGLFGLAEAMAARIVAKDYRITGQLSAYLRSA